MFSGIEAFSRVPLWTGFLLLLAVAIAGLSGWSLRRHGRRQDLYYLLLGLYLVIVQLPTVFPSLPPTLGIEWSGPGTTLGVLLALPALALLILGIRAREPD